VHSQKNKIFKFLAVVSLFAFLVINSKTITNSVRITISDAASIGLKSLQALCSGFRNIMPYASLREENRVLRQRIDILTRALDERQTLLDENARLKNLINFRKNIPYTTIPAEVIGRDPTNWSNSLIIDKGMTNGIRQNKAVLSLKGLVGRLVEVGRYSAKVLLITDANSKVGVLIRRNRQGGILLGRPDGKCKMIYIALDSDVAPGDKVMTAGFGTIFPEGIPVGEVVKVGKEPGRLYKYAIVKTAEDLSRLEEVLCIR